MRKLLIVPVAVCAFALASAGVSYAGCGSCGDHKHEKKDGAKKECCGKDGSCCKKADDGKKAGSGCKKG